jgi:hypothetical protein
MSEQNPRTEAELSELLGSIDVKAPPELHERVHAMLDRASVRDVQPAGQPGRVRLGLGIAALAATVLVLLLALNGTGSPKLDVQQAAALALASPTLPAPAENPGSPGALRVSVDGIAFPYWAGQEGWQASGSRIDTRSGRTIRTVFYDDAAGHQVGYAIVAGPAPQILPGTVHRRHGVSFHLSRLEGASVVSWLRDGHLCVVAGRGVGASTLLALAGRRERPEHS